MFLRYMGYHRCAEGELDLYGQVVRYPFRSKIKITRDKT